MTESLGLTISGKTRPITGSDRDVQYVSITII